MKTKTLLIGSLAIAATMVAGIATASADETTAATTSLKAKWGQFKEGVMERHQEMQSILAEQDYDTWKAAVDEREDERVKRFNNRVVMTDYINADNFDQFIKMHELMKAGDTEGAAAIREELGLPEAMGKMGMRGHGGRKGDCPLASTDATDTTNN